MVTVGLVAINLIHLAGFACLQVQQPLVTLVVPDGEIAVVHQRKQDIFAVVAGTGPCQTLPHRHGVEERVHLFSELPRLRIEGNLTEIILFFLVVLRIFLLQAGHII